MHLGRLFRRSVDIGIEHDVRGRKEIERLLEEEKTKAEGKNGLEKEMINEERFWNPFHDTQILTGREDDDVEILFTGIDVDVPQILVANELRKSGEKIDALLLHHPQGRASVELAKDMRLQVEMHRQYGVPVVHAEQEIESSIEKTYRGSHSDNIFEWQRTAELLKFPGLCVHTPADNLVYQFFARAIATREFDSVGEVVSAILEQPEFRHFAENGLPPLLVNCSDRSRTGRIAPTGISGGTGGPDSFIREQAAAGIGTIISMHTSDSYAALAKEHHVNIIQVNHYAADGMGMNLLLDLLTEEDPKIRAFEGCGFKRFPRKKKDRAFLENAEEEGDRSPSCRKR